MYSNPLTIVTKARLWAQEFSMSLDAKTQLPMKLPDFDDALALQLTRVPDIIDKVDHNYEIRPQARVEAQTAALAVEPRC